MLLSYSLWDDIPDHQDIHTLTWMLHDPHLATALDSYLDQGSPFHAIYQAFLPISWLQSLPQGPLSNPRTQVLNSVKRNVEASLLITLYQLRILEFLEDLDRYLAELYHASINSSAFAPSSPLDLHELTVIKWIESYWTGRDGTVSFFYPSLLPWSLLPMPLSWSHPGLLSHLSMSYCYNSLPG